MTSYLRDLMQSFVDDLVVTFACAMVFIALFCSSAGCATATPPLPTPQLRDGSEKAAAVIWRVYGRTDLPPVIHWVQGQELSCTDPDSQKPGFPQPNDEGKLTCHEGLTLTWMSCYVAWNGQEHSFSDTALAHEMAHVALFRMGVLDPEHKLVDWWGGKVPRANEALIAEGL